MSRINLRTLYAVYKKSAILMHARLIPAKVFKVWATADEDYIVRRVSN